MPFLFDRLDGKRIVVTRATEQAEEFVHGLESLGAKVVLLPTIAFVEVEDFAPLDRAVSNLDKFDWVIFTSRNGVKFLTRRFEAPQIPMERVNHLMLTPNVAVIGSATSDEAWTLGFIPAHEATESSGEALARELSEKVRGKRVLLPRSDLADSTLPDALRDAGADVVEVVAYQTVASVVDPKVLESVRQGGADVITFFSPSAYRHIADQIGVENLRRQSDKMVIASIGPTTSKAIRQDELKVGIEAPSASAEALRGAIVAYFRERHYRERVAQ
jgi:uroporphyrinogen-III synthase